MAGYQPGGGRDSGEQPGRYGGPPPGGTRSRGTGYRSQTGAWDRVRDDAPGRAGGRSGHRDSPQYGTGAVLDGSAGDEWRPGYENPGSTGARRGYPDRRGYRSGTRNGRPGHGYGGGPGEHGYGGGPRWYRDGEDTAGYGYGGADGYPARGRARRRDTTGGAEGNERLTALTGALLLVLLAAEGITILAIHQLLTLHFFIGMLLVGPVLLKAGSTLYRFARYYSGAADYRRKGPPAPLLRLLGPFVLALSLAVIGSGIMLAVTGPSGQIWMLAHKASFVLWFGAMSIHVLAYVWRLPRLLSGEVAVQAGARARQVLAGRPARWLLLAASVLLGVLLALLTYHQAGAWAGFTGGG